VVTAWPPPVNTPLNTPSGTMDVIYGIVVDGIYGIVLDGIGIGVG
jgi:hypothetical protein